MSKRPPTLSEALRAAVTASGLPLLQLEQATGVNRQSLSRFMRGERSLRLDRADVLAVYLGLTLIAGGNRSRPNG